VLKRKSILMILFLVIMPITAKVYMNGSVKNQKKENILNITSDKNITKTNIKIASNNVYHDLWLVANIEYNSKRYLGGYSYNTSTGIFELGWISEVPMMLLGVEDTDNDGIPEIYGYYDTYAEGDSIHRFYIYKVNPVNGKVIWSNQFHNRTEDHYYKVAGFEDFDGDGIREIVLGFTWFDTYPLWVFNSTTGDVVYRHIESDIGTLSQLYDYDKDGVKDIVFYGWSDSDGVPKTWIKVVSLKEFKPKTLLLLNISHDGISKRQIGDIDGDGQPEIIAGGWGGFLLVCV